eukprot:CAMPEP_0167753424 /NCGR_PEP_ID=MMETSP0110_2-20121227/7708_1 /TAXON_ID=629695 /ORGANISM="Gymnochlora sp., Strain CCMP2014" /LENGTH=367 /DNA_ID=CAMNT_0007639193 /DNA_START=165 /DNA_END=1268 /DNA_ORIENTATION=-
MLSSRCPVWKVKPQDIHLRKNLGQAVKLLKDGEVVGFPTETVYGLGGNAFCDTAIKKIFAAKGRPSNNPLIVHVAGVSQVSELVEDIPPVAETLMKKFWPGPLTIIMRTKKEKENKISSLVTCGLNSVGIRIPNHPVALALLKECGLPVAAPSANKSGKPSPTSADHVMGDLAYKISGVVDGGETGIGLESTVVDCTAEDGSVVILRPGGVTIEMLKEVVDKVSMDPAIAALSDTKLALKKNVDEKKLKPKSPGMLYTHYAPNARFVLVDGSLEFLQSIIEKAQKDGQVVGALTTEDRKVSADVVKVFASKHNDLEAASRNLYAKLRAFDETKVTVIYAPLLEAGGIGSALRNRMLKAAGKQVITEK